MGQRGEEKVPPPSSLPSFLLPLCCHSQVSNAPHLKQALNEHYERGKELRKKVERMHSESSSEFSDESEDSGSDSSVPPAHPSFLSLFPFLT